MAVQQSLFSLRQSAADSSHEACTVLGAALLSEFHREWDRDDSGDIHWVIYSLYRSHADDRGIACPSLEELRRESGLPADLVTVAISELADADCLMLAEITPDEFANSMRVYRSDPALKGKIVITPERLFLVQELMQEGEPIVIPDSLLRDPALLPATKRAAVGALLNGWKLCGRDERGAVLFVIPNDPGSSPDALIREGHRQIEQG